MNASTTDANELHHAQQQFIQKLYERNETTLPPEEILEQARNDIVTRLPDDGAGTHKTLINLDKLTKGFNNPILSSTYYGFVTGGVTPIASVADTACSVYDQNVQVHLPKETIATDIEYSTLKMLCQLLHLPIDTFTHRTFTTGATASNVLGLACGREYVISKAAERHSEDVSVGRDGLIGAMRKSRLDDIQILTTVPHSSLAKAASIVGLGRECIQLVGKDDVPYKFDLTKLQKLLRRPKTASIVVISCGEVNTGYFATDFADMQQIRHLCDEAGAFIHCDGAFGLMARCLQRSDDASKRHLQLDKLLEGCEGIELVDSITGDAHKLLNVPYDCGFFFSRRLHLATNVFRNAGAAYLNVATSNDDSENIPSPLNIGIENSRRFRALPVYASLVAYGRKGYAEMLLRQIRLAREIASCISKLKFLQLLPQESSNNFERVYIVVLFRAKDDNLNKQLVQRINRSRQIYVSGTSWDGAPAARIAISNWRVDVSTDAPRVENVLRDVYRSWMTE
ncbi:pyridoxal-dependent decarboxylase [Rhizodiscina lignyota]|uniref:Pyridoxal-dependent decarboxylase n=1 Tax=Rhizodiscina lignyota TaxID=1504668 RepID=A0A9P4M7M4_9PEZI|nr:pyridoxal-dependent decarboxylase [Rhizodiscina lignyota]